MKLVRKLNLNTILYEKIVKLGNKWQVQSEKGKNMGTYDTKAEAEKRLQQVHYFKYKNEDLVENIEKSFLEYCTDRNINYSLNDDGITCNTWRDYIKALDLLGDMKIPYKAFNGGNKQLIINKEYLTEDTRTALINKSRNAGDYKDKTHGKNRFERKKYSKVANAVKEYNQLDMNDFFKRDILTVKVPVQGETDSYTVSIKMEGVLAEIAKNVKSNKNKFEFRTVIQALTKIFNIGNVYVNCTCSDYLYNFDHWNIINNVSTSDTAHDPGPGKNIRNPKDDKGRGCKHVLLVLNNLSWLMNVASVIRNYILYAEDHMQKPFLKLIFPKIYGIPAEEMVEQDLIDDDKFLDSSKGLIDAINAYSAKRGIIPKGTNKNPAKGKGSIDLDKYNKKDEEKTDAKKDTN